MFFYKLQLFPAVVKKFAVMKITRKEYHFMKTKGGGYMQARIQVIKDDLIYNGQRVLSYTIEYPYVSSAVFQTASAAINRYYRAKAEMYRQRYRHSLYHQAVLDYEMAKTHPDIPFRPYEAYLGCTITYNDNCTLSLFFDAYQFTGGAHGNTTRTADTWDLGSARRVSMARFFAPGAAYKAHVIGAVGAQIALQMNADTGMYFDDYETNAARYFNTNNFYLVPDGLIVYYQQYQIAPYVSGIPEFLLPFSAQVQRPKCRKSPAAKPVS